MSNEFLLIADCHTVTSVTDICLYSFWLLVEIGLICNHTTPFLVYILFVNFVQQIKFPRYSFLLIIIVFLI